MNTLDYVLAPSVKALPTGTDIADDTLALIDKLAQDHRSTSHKMKVVRQKLLAAMFRFGLENLNNEQKLDALLKGREVSFNQASSFWRKVALIWLNSEFDKSVATRYGQVLEYSHQLGGNPGKLYELIEEYGFTETCRLLKQKANELTADEQGTLPPPSKQLAQQVKAAGLSKGIALEIDGPQLASGLVTLEGRIDENGKLHIAGIVPSNEKQQANAINRFVNANSSDDCNDYLLVSEIKKLPEPLHAGIGIQPNKGKSVSVYALASGDQKEMLAFHAVYPGSTSAKGLWGLVAFHEFEDGLKGKIDKKSETVPTFTVRKKISGFVIDDDFKELNTFNPKTFSMFEQKLEGRKLASKKLWSKDLQEILKTAAGDEQGRFVKLLFGEAGGKVTLGYRNHHLVEIATYVAKRSTVVTVSISPTMIQLFGQKGERSWLVNVMPMQEFEN